MSGPAGTVWSLSGVDWFFTSHVISGMLVRFEQHSYLDEKEKQSAIYIFLMIHVLVA